jgi:hypothetical protein
MIGQPFFRSSLGCLDPIRRIGRPDLGYKPLAFWVHNRKDIG